MKRILLLIALLLLIILAACQPTSVIITATPPPATATTAPTLAPTAPSATPNCGAPSDHCHYIDEPINPNWNLAEGASILLPFSETRFRTPWGEDKQKTINVPPPPGYYDWEFHLTGVDAGREMPGFLPDIFYVDNAYQVNVSSMKGSFFLRVHAQEVQANHNYLFDCLYTPQVRLVDGSKSYSETAPSWQGQAIIYNSSTGARYPFDIQGLSASRHSWGDTTIEHVQVSFKALNDMTLLLTCGLNFQYANWEGVVYFRQLRLVPVNWKDSDMQRQIR